MDKGVRDLKVVFLRLILPDLMTYVENYTAKVGQDNVNIGVVTIFRLANISLLQVY